MLQISAGAARDEITEPGMIDRSCHKTRAENAEAATETRRSLHTYLDVRGLAFC